jgi:hypothetical protein
MRILVSYHYYKKTDLDTLVAKLSPPVPDIFADSGAFSAHTQGVSVSLGEYVAWLRRWSHHFTTYSNLDVIGDADATGTNQRRLERGCRLFLSFMSWNRLMSSTPSLRSTPILL